MTVRRILQLQFIDEDSWVDARHRLAKRVASHGQALGGELELARAANGHAWLFVTTSHPTDLQRWRDAVIAPWLAASSLAAEPTTTDAELVWAGPVADTAPVADAELVVRFVAEVTGERRVWGLYGETWARADLDAPGEALPFWSNRAAAARCVEGAWSDLVPRAIDLDEFVAQWLTGMVEDGIVAVVSPRPGLSGAKIDPATLLEALEALP